jgi:predicted phage terminase large subunit-like protein
MSQIGHAKIEEAAQEARLELARCDLIEFSQYIDPAASAEYGAPHLRLIADKLEQLERGDFDRLFITCPPRHWKSSLCSEKFPLKYIGDHPKDSVIVASHAESLALKFSRTVRNNIILNENFQTLYPEAQIFEGTASVHDWAVVGAYRSTLRALGVGGSPVGGGANLIIIDDPVANFKQVSSPTQRQAILEWYLNDLRDRLEPGGKILLIMSRWHEADLAGLLLKMSKSGDGEPWETLHLPALAETMKAGKDTPEIVDPLGRQKGEALWPARWPVPVLNKIKLGQGSRAFAAKFQGSPRPDDGNILDSRKLIMVDAEEVPKRFVKIIRHWDLAFSDAQGADYVAGVKMGITTDGRRYILHLKRIHGRWTRSKPIIRDTAIEDGHAVIVSIECNGTQLGYYQEMAADTKMANRSVIKYEPDGNKEMRASMWGSRLDDNDVEQKSGIVYCLRGEWNQELFDEMDYFPNGENDDCVDGVSGAWAQLGDSFGDYSRIKKPEDAAAPERFATTSTMRVGKGRTLM